MEKHVDSETDSVYAEEAKMALTSVTNGQNPLSITALVSLFSPTLIEILGEVSSQLRFVSCEFFDWFPCKGDGLLTQNLLSAHHALFQYFPTPCSDPASEVKRLFGKFKSKSNISSIHCVWHATWIISMDAFGAICKCLQLAGQESVDCFGVALKLKGVLFDATEFWMIRSAGNTIVDLVKCKWSQGGSRERLLNFLRRGSDPWEEATTALCQSLNVAIADFSKAGIVGKDEHSNHCAFLGLGLTARVFKIDSGAVIKIVLGKNSSAMEKEYRMMRRYQKQAAVQALVIPVLEDSYRCGVVGPCSVPYSGYLLSRVGEAITPPLSNKQTLEVASLLYGLHAQMIAHGDPHISNVLLLDGQMKWIDFKDFDFEWPPFNSRMRADVLILVESLSGTLDATVLEEITAYTNTPSAEKLYQIISKRQLNSGIFEFGECC